MTGRDLIIYILANGLEDEPVFKDGKFIGFLRAEEVAVRMNVGMATVRTWVHQNKLQGFNINGNLYIPANFKPPIDNFTLVVEGSMTNNG